MADDTTRDLRLFRFRDLELVVQELPNGDLIFAATPLARGLGYRDVTDLLRGTPFTRLESALARAPGVDLRVPWVSERAAFQLVGQRRLADIPNPAVRADVDAFQAWVFGDVLPSIRRRGMYATPEVNEELANGIRATLVLLNATLKQRTDEFSARKATGWRPTPQDRESILAFTRATVDVRQFLTTALGRLAWSPNGVTLPEAVIRYRNFIGANDRLKLTGVDPWQEPQP